MAVFRVNKTKNYTVMSNYHLQDTRLSLKAKGLLSVMLSLPDTWDYSVAGLAKLSKDGKDSVQAVLKELEKNGYLTRDQQHNKNGKFETIYNIYEIPKVENLANQPQLENRERFHRNGKTVNGFPVTANPPQLNTNIQNTKKQNTNLYIFVIEHLNQIAGTAYKAETKKTQMLINARLNEGFTAEDFIKVIDKKCKEWKGTEFEKYLRPETLFGTKFESYLNAPDKKNQNPATGSDILDGIL